MRRQLDVFWGFILRGQRDLSRAVILHRQFDLCWNKYLYKFNMFWNDDLFRDKHVRIIQHVFLWRCGSVYPSDATNYKT